MKWKDVSLFLQRSIWPSIKSINPSICIDILFKPSILIVSPIYRQHRHKYFHQSLGQIFPLLFFVEKFLHINNSFALLQYFFLDKYLTFLHNFAKLRNKGKAFHFQCTSETYESFFWDWGWKFVLWPSLQWLLWKVERIDSFFLKLSFNVGGGH